MSKKRSGYTALDLSLPLFKQRGKLNQLRYLERRAQDWTFNFRHFLDVTHQSLPVRLSRVGTDNYALSRLPNERINTRSRERWIEQALWRAYSCAGTTSPNLIDGAITSVVTYQMPLRQVRDDPLDKIDIVASTCDGLPVVGEIKAEDGDTPLWMMAQGLCYALAIKKMWSHEKAAFRKCWGQRMGLATVPDDLNSVPILCAAPEGYWARRTGTPAGPRTEGQLQHADWIAVAGMRWLLRSYGYPVYFGTFKVHQKKADLTVSNFAEVQIEKLLPSDKSKISTSVIQRRFIYDKLGELISAGATESPPARRGVV